MCVHNSKAILKHFDSSSERIRSFYSQLPKLIKELDYQVTIGYMFLRTELALNRSIYCGVVKLHHGDAELCERIVNVQHMTREGFLALFKNVYGKELPKYICDKIKNAEKTRDKVLHGKMVKDAEMRKAICDVITYAEEMNAFIEKEAGFMPFGDLRGFKGRSKSLDKKTTRWILKGMGFGIN